MNNNNKLILLLREKEQLFEEVELITNDIFEAPVDMINPLLETRGAALEQIIQIDEKIKPLVVGDENLRSVLNCSCDISVLSGELRELFEESLRIRSVINRIIKNEDSIRLRIEHERDSLLEKIETMNHSSKTVAESYKRSVETSIPQGHIKNNDKSF